MRVLSEKPPTASTAAPLRKEAVAADRRPILTPANQLTVTRLALGLLLFVLLSGEWSALWGVERLQWALGVFLLAATTDALDGYLARRRRQVTTLGRILDPLVDKIVICGAYIFLLAYQPTPTDPLAGSGLAGWMVTVIVARELLVTGLRSSMERRGVHFGATGLGKIKMVLQCVTLAWILFYLGTWEGRIHPLWVVWIRDTLIWVTVFLTAASGLTYLRRTLILLQPR